MTASRSDLIYYSAGRAVDFPRRPPVRVRSYVDYLGKRKWRILDANDQIVVTVRTWKFAISVANAQARGNGLPGPTTPEVVITSGPLHREAW